MPLDLYFNKPGNNRPGEGSKVMQGMIDRYGSKKGKSVFYATVNKMKKGSPAQKAAQSRAPKDTTHQAAARRLRRQAMARGNSQRAKVESKHPFRNEPHGGPIGSQPNSY